MITSVQSDGNFTLSTITIAKWSNSAETPANRTFAGHAAFEVIDGMLKVDMMNETLSLIQGDVVFIPGGTQYSYWSDVAFTKFLYIGQGTDGLDSSLIANGTSWSSPIWPRTEFGS